MAPSESSTDKSRSIEYITETTTTTHIDSTTITDVLTSIQTSFGTTTTIATITTKAPAPANPVRRSESFSSALDQYSPESLSSACLCLNIPQCGRTSITSSTLLPSTIVSALTSATTTSSTTTITTLSTTTTTTPLLSTTTTTTSVSATPTYFVLSVTLANTTKFYLSHQNYGPVWTHLVGEERAIYALQFHINAQSTLIYIGRFAYLDDTWFRTQAATPSENAHHVIFVPYDEFGADSPRMKTYKASVASNGGVDELKLTTHYGAALGWQICYEKLPFGERGDTDWYGVTWRLQAWRFQSRAEDGCEVVKVGVEWLPV